MSGEEKQDAIVLKELVFDLIDSREWAKARLVGGYLATIYPEDPETHEALGMIWLGLNNLDQAEQSIRRALAHYDLGTVLARMDGQQEQAIKSFETAIENNPDLAPAYHGTACIYALWGKKELALNYLEKALEKGFRNKAHIEKDSDLDSLRGDSKFRELMAHYLPEN